jgi:hypothetical protein
MARDYVNVRDLASTVLPDAPSAYEVTLNRQKIEGDQGKVDAANRATAQKAAEERNKALKLPDFEGGYQGHQPFLKEVIGGFKNTVADLTYQQMMHPNDPNFDPAVEGSQANLQLWETEQVTKNKTFDLKSTGNSKIQALCKAFANTFLSTKLNELSFLGSECTKDCSGHRAGYEWSRARGGVDANSPFSPSFNNGARLARDGK